MAKQISEELYWLYVCYLGKDLGARLTAISTFVKNHDGAKFFDQYSTPKDSIKDFLERVKKAGIDFP